MSYPASYFENSWRLFLRLSATVVLTFATALLPFRADLAQVAHRVFPLARGVFEDKVANFWCVANVAVKLQRAAAPQTLAILSAALTLAAALPATLGALRHPQRLAVALAAVATAFFLFSFQVHEKSILLPFTAASAALAGSPRDRRVLRLFGLAALFSLHPLLKRDGLAEPYAALVALWLLLTAHRRWQPEICIFVTMTRKFRRVPFFLT